jgi:hypothetical protein
MDRDVILLRSAIRANCASKPTEEMIILPFLPGESEGVPLEVRNLRTRKEDVLTCPSGRLFLLDLEFHHIGGVLDNFRDICDMTRADFSKNAFIYPDNAANKPVSLRTAHGK